MSIIKLNFLIDLMGTFPRVPPLVWRLFLSFNGDVPQGTTSCMETVPFSPYFKKKRDCPTSSYDGDIPKRDILSRPVPLIDKVVPWGTSPYFLILSVDLKPET